MTEPTNGNQLPDLKELGIEERSAILYYADYLSLKSRCKTATDSCKYFFINGFPINSAFLLEDEPDYHRGNQFIIQSYNEYQLIKEKFGLDAVKSFIGDVCMIQARGSIGPEDILAQIHLYSTKYERKQAFREYEKKRRKRKYYHKIIDEDGNVRKEPCSKYVWHAERRLEKQHLPMNTGMDGEKLDK